jgi:hypothetical protein
VKPQASSRITYPTSGNFGLGEQDLTGPPRDLCVPKTSSTSCDQAVLVDQASSAGSPSDAVPVEIDRFG